MVMLIERAFETFRDIDDLGEPGRFQRLASLARANAAADGSGYGEGQLWIGTRYAPTDGSGNLILNATAGSWNNIPAGTMISCTATQDGT